MAVRDSDEILDRIEELESRDPTQDEDAWISDHEAIEVEAKTRILYWALEERDERRIYERWRELCNTGTTCDRQGAKTQVRIGAKREALNWVMGEGQPEDPERFYDRLDEVSSELFNLVETALKASRTDDPAGVPEGIDPDEHEADAEEIAARTGAEIEPVNDVDFDPSYLYDKLDRAWRITSDARTHMLNEGAEDDYTETVTVGDLGAIWEVESDTQFIALVRSVIGSSHFTLDYDDEETLERIVSLDDEHDFLRESDRDAVEEALSG